MSLIHLVKEIKDIRRFEQILVVLVKNELGFLVDKIKLKHFIPTHIRIQKHKFKERGTNAVRIRKALEELGATFIKLGQLLSLRPDLIPKEFCDEFRKMQDEVPGFSVKVAKEIVKKELAKEGKAFAYLSPKPIAAASIGQVHEAVLKNGKKVVVKIQRPEIRKRIETDLDILFYLAKKIEKHIGTDIINATEIIKEFERYTKDELDFVNEARNIDRFYKNFEHDKSIVIPKVYWDYTTDRILTMEFIEGFNASEIKKIEKRTKERKRIATQVTELIFKQVFIHGLFHADPHPGNILILKEKRIGLLDFGIIGNIDNEMKRNFSELFVGLIDIDLDAVTEAMLSLGIVEGSIDTDMLKKDLSDTLGRYYNTPLKEVNISYLFHSLMEVARKDKIKLPSDFVLLGKAIITVEGFAVELDPEFNLVEAARPFVKKLKKRAMEPKYILAQGKKSLHKFSRMFTRLPDSVNDLMYRARDVDKGIRDIDKDMKTMTVELDKSSNRVTSGMLIAAFVIASALTINVGTPVLFGIGTIPLIGFAISAVILFSLIISVIREKKR